MFKRNEKENQKKKLPEFDRKFHRMANNEKVLVECPTV